MWVWSHSNGEGTGSERASVVDIQTTGSRQVKAHTATCIRITTVCMTLGAHARTHTHIYTHTRRQSGRHTHARTHENIGHTLEHKTHF